LNLSVIENKVASVKLLLATGADINIRNNKCEKATSLAELGENKLMIDLLNQHKEKIKLLGLF